MKQDDWLGAVGTFIAVGIMGCALLLALAAVIWAVRMMAGACS